VEPKKKEYIMVAHPNGKKIAFITGANKGTGFEVARQLGQRGMAVIIGARGQQCDWRHSRRAVQPAATSTPADRCCGEAASSISHTGVDATVC
jgi:NAD(P)-dependent dehydrogenase (short-subunit alcohol dehydrogenase family)